MRHVLQHQALDPSVSHASQGRASGSNLDGHVVDLVLGHAASTRPASLRVGIDEDRRALSDLALRRFVARDISDLEHRVASAALRDRIASAEAARHHAHTLAGLRQHWNHLSLRARRQFIRAHIAEITIDRAPPDYSRRGIDARRIHVIFHPAEPTPTS
jgi:hypothetical protein